MNKRPILFEASCIFSIIGSSIYFIGMFLCTFFFKIATEKISIITNLNATEKLSPLYFAILMAAYCLSLAGAIKLYKLQRSGLWFYLSAQLIVLVLPAIWINSNAFSVSEFIFATLFSGVYLYNYRILK